MTRLNEIRSKFLNYFSQNDHEIVSSSPLVPRNDPTLMFTNCGMVQFKNVFTGLESRDYVRAATSQKCVRAGGKHNDLDNVGYTTRHHTFFEMLGNFSFGDYFKEQAIYHCWTLITKELGVNKDHLLATVYIDDDEAADLWKSIAGFSNDRIIRISGSDNFWSMGPVGPCGPCSELFYDFGEEIPGGPPGSEDEDGDRFIEIWNLVFMQFEQFSDGSQTKLPHPSIDTGMGLERIGALLQGTNDNYETDLFRSLIESVGELTKSDPNGPLKVHHRVIADHIRSSAFLLAEGVMPSRDGRGYVLRRIMRRAMRHGYLLGDHDPIMYRLLPVLIEEMGAAFPELSHSRETIEYILQDEEVKFRRTLGRGLSLLDEELEKIPEDSALPGETAFKLYDTFGFPLDLTQDAVRELGRTVDVHGFNEAMNEQRQRARSAMGGIGETSENSLWIELADKQGATEFLGYNTDKADAQILAIVAEDKIQNRVEKGSSIKVIVNQTPFYGESGGQYGDGGLMITDSGQAEINNTIRISELFIHMGVVTEGFLISNSTARLEIKHSRRQKTRANHSATHLLHETLRRILGKHVAQRGSLNDEDRLRFDFSHTSSIDIQTLSMIEKEVNSRIRENSPVITKVMTPEDAIDDGAMALFGEKYGDRVRVVSMGNDTLEGNDRPFSIELCGGTHVSSTGEIGLFVITGESSTASGIRRIEALTGEKAYNYLSGQDRRMAQISLLLNQQGDKLIEKIESLLAERKSLHSEISRLRHNLAMGQENQTNNQAKIINNIQFIGQEIDNIPARDLRLLIDSHKKRLETGIVALVSSVDGKSAVAVGVTENLTDRFSAVEIIRRMTPELGGSGGGGRDDFAQGGGPNTSGGAQAIIAAEKLIKEK